MRPLILAILTAMGDIAGFSRLLAQDCPKTGGVQLVEWPERGPSVQAGRPLQPSFGADYGVDINSRIEVKIDTLCLAKLLDSRAGNLPQPMPQGLGQRLDSLSAAVAGIPMAIQRLQHAFAAYAPGVVGPDTVFQNRLRASSTAIRQIITTLSSAIKERLEASGTPASEAELAAKDEVATAYAGPEKMGYDWDVIGRLINREIQFAAAEISQRRDQSDYRLEIQAHLLTEKGQYPVPLTGYNEEVACVPTRIEPIQLALPAEQSDLYQQAESLASQIGKVRGFGNVVIKSLSADVSRLRPEAETLFAQAGRASTPVAAAAKQLLRWRNPDTVRVWLASIAGELRQDPRGVALRATLDSLTSMLQKVSANLESLRLLGSLKSELPATASDVSVAVLTAVSEARTLTLGALQPAAWTAAASMAERFLKRVGDLAPELRARIRDDERGPVRDAQILRDALQQAADSLRGISQHALALLARVTGLRPAFVAADLPEPAGLRRRPFTADLGTNLRLTEICADRRENDEVQVQYRLFAGEQALGERTDRLHLRFFGWRSRVAAGLAFALRQNAETWQPGAAVSWIFTHGSWPTGENRGLGDRGGLGQIGFGLTAMNLHFESDEAIELGIGPSLSFLNDRVILGGGWNLQAHDDHLYGLLSIRLLDIARTKY